jgi:hypothetical protein
VMAHVVIYIYMQLQTVMLYLRHDFYNIIFKIKHKLYIAPGVSPTPLQNFGCAPEIDKEHWRKLPYEQLRNLYCTSRIIKMTIIIGEKVRHDTRNTYKNFVGKSAETHIYIYKGG